MRLIFRIVGTWLIGIALILLIIDGIRSLGANSLIITSLGDTWTTIHADSLVAVREFFGTRMFGAVLDGATTALLGFPGWAVLGVPGLLIAWMGRSRRARMFVRQDQF